MTHSERVVISDVRAIHRYVWYMKYIPREYQQARYDMKPIPGIGPGKCHSINVHSLAHQELFSRQKFVLSAS